MSNGLNSWTRLVQCSVIVPIRIDPKAPAEEAEEVVRELIRNNATGTLILTPEEMDVFAIPLKDDPEEIT